MGTVKVTPEWIVPVLSVVKVPDKVRAEPLKVPLNVVELAPYPLPVTVTTVPATALVVLKEREGWIVKVAVADRAGVAALMVKVCDPTALSVVPDGTVKVTPLKVPVPLVVVVPDKVTTVEPKVADRVELAGKFDPDTVTVEPTTPWAGLGLVIEMDGVGMVKVTVFELVLPAWSVTTTA